jgi:hypothetical protein
MSDDDSSINPDHLRIAHSEFWMSVDAVASYGVCLPPSVHD